MERWTQTRPSCLSARPREGQCSLRHLSSTTSVTNYPSTNQMPSTLLFTNEDADDITFKAVSQIQICHSSLSKKKQTQCLWWENNKAIIRLMTFLRTPWKQSKSQSHTVIIELLLEGVVGDKTNRFVHVHKRRRKKRVRVQENVKTTQKSDSIVHHVQLKIIWLKQTYQAKFTFCCGLGVLRSSENLN